MRPKPRERFNAKARKSQVGGSSHKGKKSRRERQIIEADSNAQIIDEATRDALAEQDVNAVNYSVKAAMTKL